MVKPLNNLQVNIVHLAITILSLFITFFGLFSCVQCFAPFFAAS